MKSQILNLFFQSPHTLGSPSVSADFPFHLSPALHYPSFPVPSITCGSLSFLMPEGEPYSHTSLGSKGNRCLSLSHSPLSLPKNTPDISNVNLSVSFILHSKETPLFSSFSIPPRRGEWQRRCERNSEENWERERLKRDGEVKRKRVQETESEEVKRRKMGKIFCHCFLFHSFFLVSFLSFGTPFCRFLTSRGVDEADNVYTVNELNCLFLFVKIPSFLANKTLSGWHININREFPFLRGFQFLMEVSLILFGMINCYRFR